MYDEYELGKILDITVFMKVHFVEFKSLISTKEAEIMLSLFPY